MFISMQFFLLWLMFSSYLLDNGKAIFIYVWITIEILQVHTLSSVCLIWGTCNVGIAIRSHDTVFVVRTVDEVFNPLDFANTAHDYTATVSGRRTYPFVDYRHCNDQNMLIERTGKTFTVIKQNALRILFNKQFKNITYKCSHYLVELVKKL